MPYSNLPILLEPVFDETTDTVVRQSTIGQMQLCPMRVGLEGKSGYLEPVSEVLVFGTCEHYIISQTLLAGEERLDLLTNMGEWVSRILEEDYDWSLDRIDRPQEFFSELSVSYRTWCKTVWPKLKEEPIAIEQEMWLPLGEGSKGRIWLRGTPDLVLPSTLIDWKTSSREWKKAKADLSIQASLYMALVKQNLDLPIRKFTFWVYERPKAVWHKVQTSRLVAQIDSALVTAYQYGLQIEAGIYPATPVPDAAFIKKRGWYCSAGYCPAWNICEAKYMNDDVNEREIAERKW